MVLITAGEICGYIDNELTSFIHTIILVIEIATIILLIVLGMLDFAKSVMASKEDEIQKGKNIFIKRCISAVIVFFVFSIAQFITGILASEDSQIWSCAAAIMNGTNKKVSTSSIPVPSQIDSDIKEDCCTQAGGQIDSNGVCNAYNDNDGNRHEVNSEVYNQCTQSKEKAKEQEKNAKQQNCCTQAGGQLDSNGSCNSYKDSYGEYHNANSEAYNQCMK